MKKLFAIVALLAMVLGAHAEATIGYLMTMDNKEAFPAEAFEGVDEKPEYNAAAWFETTYVNNGTGRFVSLNEAATADLSALKVIWVNVDRVGLENIGAAGVDANVVAGLKKFVENGGNLFVTKQANQVIFQMGRMGYAPGWAAGGYQKGGDNWVINSLILGNLGADNRIDQSAHPIYKDVNFEEHEVDGYKYKKYLMVGAVSRTDNNNMWIDMFRKDPTTGGLMADLAGTTHYDNGNPLRLTDFEQDWNCEVLGVWGHVMDACAPGLIVFNPEGNFKGQIISCGFAAYQWGTSNNYLDNVKKLTANALDILNVVEDGPSTSVENVQSSSIVKGVYNLLGQKVARENMVRGTIYIVDGKKVIY